MQDRFFIQTENILPNYIIHNTDSQEANEFNNTINNLRQSSRLRGGLITDNTPFPSTLTTIRNVYNRYIKNEEGKIEFEIDSTNYIPELIDSLISHNYRFNYDSDQTNEDLISHHRFTNYDSYYMIILLSINTVLHVKSLIFGYPELYPKIDIIQSVSNNNRNLQINRYDVGNNIPSYSSEHYNSIFSLKCKVDILQQIIRTIRDRADYNFWNLILILSERILPDLISFSNRFRDTNNQLDYYIRQINEISTRENNPYKEKIIQKLNDTKLSEKTLFAIYDLILQYRSDQPDF